MRLVLLICISVLSLPYLSFAQITTPVQKANLYVTGGWGAGDGQQVQEDYNLWSVGLRYGAGRKIMILRFEEGKDAISKQQEYKLREVKVLCGYNKRLRNNNDLYLAAGISRSRHYYSGSYLSKTGQGRETVELLEQYWGIPVESGFMVKLSPRIVLGGIAFVNLNRIVVYAGYQVQVAYKLF